MNLMKFNSHDITRNACMLHNKLWNGGNGRGLIRLYDKTPEGPQLVDEIMATHIGCEYGEYGENK